MDSIVLKDKHSKIILLAYFLSYFALSFYGCLELEDRYVFYINNEMDCETSDAEDVFIDCDIKREDILEIHQDITNNIDENSSYDVTDECSDIDNFQPRFLGLRNIIGISNSAAGESHICILLSNKEVRCLGSNSRGELGGGFSSYSNLPVPVLITE